MASKAFIIGVRSATDRTPVFSLDINEIESNRLVTKSAVAKTIITPGTVEDRYDVVPFVGVNGNSFAVATFPLAGKSAMVTAVQTGTILSTQSAFTAAVVAASYTGTFITTLPIDEVMNNPVFQNMLKTIYASYTA